MKKDKISPRIPLWFKVLTGITALPLLAWPWAMRQATLAFGDISEDSLSWAFVVLSPVYVVMSTWLSCRVYPDWPALAWVLQAWQVMTYVALWVLYIG